MSTLSKTCAAILGSRPVAKPKVSSLVLGPLRGGLKGLSDDSRFADMKAVVPVSSSCNKGPFSVSCLELVV